jgi:hypothetical protein
VGESGQAREARAPVEVSGERRDAVGAQQRVALRAVAEGEQAVAPPEQRRGAQRHVPAADDQQAPFRSHHAGILTATR